MMKTRNLVVCVALLVIAGSSWASVITVENYGFELPGTGKIKDFTQIPGWSTDTAPADSGVENNNTLGTDEDGDGAAWIAFMMGGDPSVWQTTDHVITEGDQLELTVSGFNTWVSTSIYMSLYADNAGVRTEIAGQSVAVGTPADFTLNYTILAGDASIGQNLGVEFYNDSSNWNGIDNVRLNLVPEPTTMCLLGLGGFAMLRRKRA